MEKTNDINLYEKCFNDYYLSKDPITNKLKEQEIIKYANEYLNQDLSNNIKKINKAKKFKVEEIDEKQIRIYNDKKSIDIFVDFDKEKLQKRKAKEILKIEQFLNDLSNSNTNSYSPSMIKELQVKAYYYYLENLIMLKNNKYKEIYEKFLLPKFNKRMPKELKDAIYNIISNDLELQKKLFYSFLKYYPLNSTPTTTNSTVEIIILRNLLEDTPYTFFKIPKNDIIKMLKNYSKSIVDKDILKQFDNGIKKFSDSKYDDLKYNFDLYEGVKYNSERLKKMYINRYDTIERKAKLYIELYLDNSKKKEIKDVINESKEAQKVNIIINDNYLSIFKKLSEFQTIDIVCDYLDAQNITVDKLQNEFNIFKDFIKDKYSKFVIDDIEEKLNNYIEVKENIRNYKKVIQNICDDILSDSSKTKQEYFKSYGINDVEKIEKIVSKYYPDIYVRYIEKIKLLEKSEVDKILNKIKELGNNFTIFDYANTTDLNIEKFVEKIYEFYPKNKDNNLIMEMDFAKSLTSLDIDIDKYYQDDSYIAFENDLYLLDENDKKEVIQLLNDNNLPINSQTCKIAAKKILENRFKKVKTR